MELSIQTNDLQLKIKKKRLNIWGFCNRNDVFNRHIKKESQSGKAKTLVLNFAMAFGFFCCSIKNLHSYKPTDT